MTYVQFVQRGQALACLLAPTLSIFATIFFLIQNGFDWLFASREIFNDTDALKVNYSLFQYEAHLLMIPAFFALASIVAKGSPRLAMVGVVMALFGLGSMVGASYLMVHVGIAARDGLPVTWDFAMQSGPTPEMLIIGLPIILYFIANILMGVGVLRSGALTRFYGVLLIAVGLLQFDSIGPQPSNMPMLTGLLAPICLLFPYVQVATRKWRASKDASKNTPVMTVSESLG